jgi:Mor family transcriptional regulator
MDPLAEFERYVESYRRRLAELETARAELIAERDAEIRRAHAAGVTVGALAERLRLSHQRVSQIVRQRRQRR